MTDEVRQELEGVDLNYPDYHLNRTYYHLLSHQTREELADKLLRFLRPLRLSGNDLTGDEKARLLYEVLSKCLRYDHTDYPENEGELRYTYAGGILSGKAVCMGIAELYTLLGTSLGLRVQTVIGYGGDPKNEGGLHAWNIVWLKDGRGQETPYHIDLTWDLESHASLRGFKFYLKGDAYMEQNDHTWLKENYPACPRNRDLKDIPKIPAAAVELVSSWFRAMRPTN